MPTQSKLFGAKPRKVEPDPKLMKRVITALEWCDSTASEGAYMGGPPMSYHASCPMCGGLKRDEHAERNFIAEAFGHRKGCEIAKILGRETC